MTTATATRRASHESRSFAPAAKTFWESAQRVAELAAEVVIAPRSVLVEEGAKFYGHAIEPHELAADLASLNEQIRLIRQRLSEDSHERLIPTSQRVRAQQNMASMVREGMLVPPAVFAQALGITRQALSKALKARRVFYVEVAGERCYPEFFLDPRYERRQLERVSQALGELPGASKLQFFLNSKAALNGATPLEALAKGRYAQVRTAAEGFAER